MVYLLELSSWEIIFNIFYIFSGSVKKGLVDLIDQLENLSTILTVLGPYENYFQNYVFFILIFLDSVLIVFNNQIKKDV